MARLSTLLFILPFLLVACGDSGGESGEPQPETPASGSGAERPIDEATLRDAHAPAGMGQAFLVGVISAPDQTVFVKLQGPTTGVVDLRGGWIELCRSVRFEGGSLKFDTPGDFRSEPGGGPMRVASFYPTSGAEGVEGAITVMGSDAGGIGNNVNRWRGQLGMQELSAADMQPFLEASESYETSSGLPVLLVDLTK